VQRRLAESVRQRVLLRHGRTESRGCTRPVPRQERRTMSQCCASVCVCVCHGRNAELASITSQDEDDYVADEMSVSDEIDESPKLQ